MKKINFINKKKPSISATNLNQLQTNIENEFYYKDGDIYVITASTGFSGWLTGGSASINFCITVPKSLEKINSFTISEMNVTVRHIGGGYLYNKIDVASLFKTVKTSENTINFSYIADTAFSATNNTPLSVVINKMTLTFSETATTSVISEE